MTNATIGPRTFNFPAFIVAFLFYTRCATCFLTPHTTGTSRGGRTLQEPTDFPSIGALASASASASASSSASIPEPTVSSLSNPSIAAPSPREFPWWNADCDKLLDELDGAGGERFVASQDEQRGDRSGGDKEEDQQQQTQTTTRNWLHVTSSSPDRRVQYELRYVKTDLSLAGIVRFGADCEGPPGHVHGGAMATVADATTATVAYKASGRWGLTTRLDCNYREMLPVDTPVKVEARVKELKKRRATVEWTVSSLTRVDRKGGPLQHSFGTAEFLLPREDK